MIRKRFLVSVMAAALILGGTAPASKTQVKAADQKIIVLKTPQQASKAINQSTSANSKGRSANAKMTKQQREELLILLCAIMMAALLMICSYTALDRKPIY